LREIKYFEAINEALRQAMEQDDSVFLMGLGVDDPKGIFGSTLGLWQQFGRERVFDMPIAENGMTGIAIGAALAGMRPVMSHQRMDFMLYCMDQLINHAAKWRYMSGGLLRVPLTVRAIIGRGWGQGAQHSQSLQALFAHVPGLKVAMPVSPYDVKGLLLASIADDNPVIFIEHRRLYDLTGPVPEEPYTIPLGKGVIRREGKDVTIIATSYMVTEAEQAADALTKEGIEVELIDPRTLKPLDEELILNSVKKTGRLVVADNGWKTAGVGAEIAARVAYAAFDSLKAPIVRVAFPDVPTPTSVTLEQAFYPGSEDIVAAVKEVLLGESQDTFASTKASEDEFTGPF
jgi:pyruvate dehydrogenase E1 component beta subunit